MRDAENERLGEFTARTLYFHPSTEGTTLLYGLSAYQERFGAGNSRGMPLPELENVLRDGRERLEAAGVRGVDLRLANVSTPKIGPPPEEMAHLVAAPNPLQRRFCIWVDAEAYRDASPKFYHGVEYDYGEDFGRDVVALARALVVVYDSAGAIFAGHTGANGCTPWVQTNDTGGFTVYYMPWYRDDDNSVLMYVTDYEQDYGVPLYVFEDVDPYWPTAILFVDWLNRPLTIYGAASASVERFPGGYDDVTYEISWGTPGNGGTATDYNQGIPRVKIDENGFAFCPRVRRLCQGALLPDMVDSPIMPCDL